MGILWAHTGNIGCIGSIIHHANAYKTKCGNSVNPPSGIAYYTLGDALGVILQYMVSVSFSCFLWLVKGY